MSPTPVHDLSQVSFDPSSLLNVHPEASPLILVRLALSSSHCHMLIIVTVSYLYCQSHTRTQEGKDYNQNSLTL